VLGDEESWTKVASDACFSLKTPIWSQISTYQELGGGGAGGGAGGEGTSGWVELEADHNLIIMVQITELYLSSLKSLLQLHRRRKSISNNNSTPNERCS
jgi:hypothetical protein